MKSFHAILFSLATLLFAAALFTGYLSINHINGASLGGFVSALDGTAHRPSAYRVLIPALAQAGAGFIPLQFIHPLNTTLQNTVLAKALDNLSGGIYYREAFCALLLMYLALAGFIFIEKAFLRDLGYPIKLQYLLPFSLAILSLLFSVYFAYVYDLPQMFLFATCVLFLHQRKWALYLALLAITTLNKETSFFLIIIFASYYYHRLPRRLFAILLTAQAGIFFVLRSMITNIYKNNPGSVIFLSTKAHIDQYIAYPPALIFTILFFSVMTFLIFKDWQKKPIFLRHASSAFFFVLILFFVGGMPFEFRVFLDVYPVFGIMLFPHGNDQFLAPEKNISPSNFNHNDLF